MWNFYIVFVMEGLLTLLFSGYLNVVYSGLISSAVDNEYTVYTYESFASWLNLIYAVVFLFLSLISPIFIVVFYLKNQHLWKEESFLQVYGGPLEGLNLEKKASLLHPLFFCIRRILLLVVTINMYPHVTFQLLTMAYVSHACYILFVTVKPFEETFEYKMQVYNEVTTLMLCLSMFGLTNAFDPIKQFYCGYLNIFIFFQNICVHLWFIMLELYKKQKMKFINYLRKRKGLDKLELQEKEYGKVNYQSGNKRTQMLKNLVSNTHLNRKVRKRTSQTSNTSEIDHDEH